MQSPDGGRMSYHYPGLFARGRLFYIRVRIPARLRMVARCGEIKLTLNTSIYQEAIENYMSDLFSNSFKAYFA